MQVTLLLSSPEITVQPSLNEVKRVLGRLMRCLVESAKPFARWMDGTCILCPAQPSGPDDEDPFLHSFYGDVSQHPHVVKAMLALSSVAQAAVTGITRSALGLCFPAGCPDSDSTTCARCGWRAGPVLGRAGSSNRHHQVRLHMPRFSWASILQLPQQPITCFDRLCNCAKPCLSVCLLASMQGKHRGKEKAGLVFSCWTSHCWPFQHGQVADGALALPGSAEAGLWASPAVSFLSSILRGSALKQISMW